jgi:copper chaperone CopZ
MFRRRFLQLVTFATAGGLAPLQSIATGASRMVTYRVKGFSCITCATGLDTMLGQQKGITSSQSSYPDGRVTVGFNPEQVSEKTVVAFIADLGFTVENENEGDFLPASPLKQRPVQPRMSQSVHD